MLHKTENWSDLIEFASFVTSFLNIFHVINKYTD